MISNNATNVAYILLISICIIGFSAPVAPRRRGLVVICRFTLTGLRKVSDIVSSLKVSGLFKTGVIRSTHRGIKCRNNHQPPPATSPLSW